MRRLVELGAWDVQELPPLAEPAPRQSLVAAGKAIRYSVNTSLNLSPLEP